ETNLEFTLQGRDGQFPCCFHLVSGDRRRGARATPCDEPETYWQLRGFYSEGRGWFDRLLGHPRAHELSDSARCNAILSHGQLATWQGDYAGAIALLEEASEAFQKRDHVRGQLSALSFLASTLAAQGNNSRAVEVATQVIELGRPLAAHLPVAN